MLHPLGYRIAVSRSCSGLHRVSHYYSDVRTGWFVLEANGRWLTIKTSPWTGMWVRTISPKGVAVGEQVKKYPRNRRRDMKRLSVAAEGLPAIPAISVTSTMLPKSPKLREFLTATAYDDGSMRTPGYLWLTNRGTTLEMTLFDWDSACQMKFSANTFDDLLALAETLLSAPTAPWMPDPFLAERKARMKPKKKA